MSDNRYKTMNKKLPKTDMVDFRTPLYLQKFIKDHWDFEYDAACEAGVNNLAKPLRLEDEWVNNTIIYSNPPFDDESLIKWIKKGHEWVQQHTRNIHVILIPNKLNHVKIQKETRGMINKLIFLGGRVDFDSIHSVKGGSSRNGSVLIIQGHQSEYSKRSFDFILLSDLKKEYGGSE